MINLIICWSKDKKNIRVYMNFIGLKVSSRFDSNMVSVKSGTQTVQSLNPVFLLYRTIMYKFSNYSIREIKALL